MWGEFRGTKINGQEKQTGLQQTGNPAISSRPDSGTGERTNITHTRDRLPPNLDRAKPHSTTAVIATVVPVAVVPVAVVRSTIVVRSIGPIIRLVIRPIIGSVGSVIAPSVNQLDRCR